jgi:hypothetical protein
MTPEVLEAEYRGPATIGAWGRARFQDRAGGIGEMVWEALRRAGWIGESVGIRTTVFLRIRVAFVPEEQPPTRSQVEPLPGAKRRRVGKGWVDEDQMACQVYEGPLNGRAAGPGYRLLEAERRPEDLEFGEDMLYAAAIRAGWLSGDGAEAADVPDVHITVGVTRR